MALKLYIGTASGLTYRWHSGGGFAVLAHDEAEAIATLEAERMRPELDDDGEPEVWWEPPTGELEVYSIEEVPLWGTEPSALIFPNAGCC